MKTELSAVVPVFNEGPGVAGFLEALAEALARGPLTNGEERQMIEQGKLTRSRLTYPRRAR